MIVLQKDESYMITFRIGEVSICFIPQNFVDDSLFRKSLLFIRICEYLRNLRSKLWDSCDTGECRNPSKIIRVNSRALADKTKL